ncbi:hypothetical protein [Micromonospora sp. NPDC049891]|uniref:hypothetical protein n=1 Tax=Micromonospora sp. NPDC049891 TaxID=3155655 RepID=UPI0033CFBCDA
MSGPQVRRWDSAGQFAAPRSGQGRHRRWRRTDLYQWAATSPLHLADRVPLSHWPAATGPRPYLGARLIADSVALLWAAPVGTMAVVWPISGRRPAPRGHLSPLLRAWGVVGAATVATGLDGGAPGVEPLPMTPAQDAGSPLSWTELSELIGQPLPYWPLPLRREVLITRWRPGQPAVEALAGDPELDTDALLRMASLYEADHPAARLLVELARAVFRHEAESAGGEIDAVARAVGAGTTVVAARPMPVPAVDRDDVDEGTRRAGWWEILCRQDTLAEHCLLQMLKWDNGADCPFGHRFTVRAASPTVDEWIARLEPTPRSAAFRLLGEVDADDETLRDPATDAPVVRRRDGDEIELRGAAPQRLRATSPLAEIILDHPIWVRTADGTLYPAPQGSYWGIGWGYPGFGPGCLALLIDRLLDDINARAADSANGAPVGLQRLTRITMPRGTVLTREQLESARAGTWQPTRDDFPAADEEHGAAPPRFM